MISNVNIWSIIIVYKKRDWYVSYLNVKTNILSYVFRGFFEIRYDNTIWWVSKCEISVWFRIMSWIWRTFFFYEIIKIFIWKSYSFIFYIFTTYILTACYKKYYFFIDFNHLNTIFRIYKPNQIKFYWQWAIFYYYFIKFYCDFFMEQVTRQTRTSFRVLWQFSNIESTTYHRVFSLTVRGERHWPHREVTLGLGGAITLYPPPAVLRNWGGFFSRKFRKIKGKLHDVKGENSEIARQCVFGSYIFFIFPLH